MLPPRACSSSPCLTLLPGPVLMMEYCSLGKNRTPEQSILPYAQEHRRGVVVRGPPRMGLLTGKFTPETRFPEGDIRKDWPPQRWFQESLKTIE